jgi:ubiquitin carboxyl-terminal hydrolase 34
MNTFGNLGGFDLIIDVLENAEMTDKEDELNVTIMGCLAQIITTAFPVYHKDFITEFGQRIATSITKRLLSTSDQSLRDVRKEQIEAILKSVDSISKRFLEKDEREKQSEVLKLELCNKCLTSNYLERRIQGIRDLNTLVRSTSIYASGSRAFTSEFLIQWMREH